MDHPRACGEHTPSCGVPHPCSGSSPRMRGALGVVLYLPRGRGIIPAYAGSTNQVFIRVLTVVGSSPRMRGAQSGLTRVDGSCRIIPAYAGSTCRWCTDSNWPKDHPRVCGEHLDGPAQRGFGTGSSPRMRGAHKPHVFDTDRDGIIPAYAGSTFRSSTCN